MSDIASGADQAVTDQTSETPTSEARQFREVSDDREKPNEPADTVRALVREAPLFALASAFVVGVMFGRR